MKRRMDGWMDVQIDNKCHQLGTQSIQQKPTREVSLRQSAVVPRGAEKSYFSGFQVKEYTEIWHPQIECSQLNRNKLGKLRQSGGIPG